MTRAPEESPVPAAATIKARIEHVNEVVLVGELAGAPESRTLPTGEEVLSFRVTVRGGASPPPQGRPARTTDSGRGRKDSVDCVAVRAGLRVRVARYGTGDLIRVEGSLRHRYWRGPGGINSRYEVEAGSTSLVKRQPTPPP